eukprot:14382-Heterococcus_DN1.PRE.2
MARRLVLYPDAIVCKDATGVLLCAIVISRATAQIMVTSDPQELVGDREGQTLAIDGIFGVYEMLSGPFLAVIVSSKKVFSDADTGIKVPIQLLKHCCIVHDVKVLIASPCFARTTRQYNKVTKMSLIPILKEPKQLTQQQRCAAMTVNSPTLLKQTSLSLGSYSQKANDQRQQVFTSDAQWDRADDRFFWNRNLVNSLIAAGADEWIMPLLNGHVEVKRNCRIGGTGKGKFTLLIVARRSRKQQGCRYIKRGCAVPGATAADKPTSGDVSNFCEIEQIVVPDRGGVSSYVQVLIMLHICVTIILPATCIFTTFNNALVTLLSLVDKQGQQGRLGKLYQTIANKATAAATVRPHDDADMINSDTTNTAPGDNIPHFLW